MGKCIQCGKKIDVDIDHKEGVLWCDMFCKKDFLLDNYSATQGRIWFADRDKALLKSRKKILAEIKKSGLTTTEYISFLNTS